MIYVTHDQVEAMTLADKIVVLDRGDIQQVGSPMELYERPANLFVAQFIGSPKMNVMEARIAEGGLEIAGGRGRIPAPNLPAGAVRVGIRPEDVALVPPGQGHLEGTIDVVERLGSDTYAYATAEGLPAPLTLRIVGNAATVAVGQRAGLAFDAARLHLFDAAGTTLR
jgi:multiple sugar transport system ATP-binding protein